MARDGSFEIFLVAVPGLEKALWAEARAAGFRSAQYAPGGVVMKGHWPDVWRANLELRGASRVLARLDAFKAEHLTGLEMRARRVPWGRVLRRDNAVHVDATCSRSRIYHSGAAAERVERAIRTTLGVPVSKDAEVTIKVRIDDNRCAISIDTSGELLHKRGHKQEVNKAPMRETLSALFLRECGYDGREAVLDPMCGSGTFVIEAAEMAAGLRPGRARSFAFEHLATFDEAAWRQMRGEASPGVPDLRFYGSDQDAGAVRMSRANAERAGVAALTEFRECGLEELARPDCAPGLVIVNPPYGDRLGETGRLAGLYRTLGATLKARLSGWRVGLVASDPALAHATGLPFARPSEPVLNGGLRVTLYRTGPLA